MASKTCGKNFQVNFFWQEKSHTKVVSMFIAPLCLLKYYKYHRLQQWGFIWVV